MFGPVHVPLPPQLFTNGQSNVLQDEPLNPELQEQVFAPMHVPLFPQLLTRLQLKSEQLTP